MKKFILSRLIPAILAILVAFTSSLMFPTVAWAIPSSSMAALPIVKNFFRGTTPDNLGVNDGHLASCPTSPNCVVSQDGDESHSIAPFTYDTDLASAKEILLKILAVVPRTEIIEETDNYIRFQSESRLLGFIDDGEFYFPQDEKVIHVRSASRVGDSDLGVNRRRLEQIRLALQDLTN